MIYCNFRVLKASQKTKWAPFVREPLRQRERHTKAVVEDAEVRQELHFFHRFRTRRIDCRQSQRRSDRHEEQNEESRSFTRILLFRLVCLLSLVFHCSWSPHSRFIGKHMFSLDSFISLKFKLNFHLTLTNLNPVIVASAAHSFYPFVTPNLFFTPCVFVYLFFLLLIVCIKIRCLFLLFKICLFWAHIPILFAPDDNRYDFGM